MKIAFTGHRNASAPAVTLQHILDTYPDSIWLHGGAVGVDTSVDKFARDHAIQVVVYYPNYELYGRRAPLIRNMNMLDHCDFLVAFYDGRITGGTYFTIMKAKEKRIPVIQYNPGPLGFGPIQTH